MKNSNTINLKLLMKENSFIQKNGVKEYLRISPETIHEYKTRFIDVITDDMPKIAEIADRYGRKTIQASDLIEFYGIVANEIRR
jgi:histone H3/H4